MSNAQRDQDKGGQGSAVVEASSRFARKSVQPGMARSIVPPPPGKATNPESGAPAPVAKKAANKATKKATKKTAAAAGQAGAGRQPATRSRRGTSKVSLPALFIKDVMSGSLGDCSAERKDDSMLIRRWNGSFWELLTDTSGKSEAQDWLYNKHPYAMTTAKTVDCWESLKNHLYKHKHFEKPSLPEDEVVLPLRDGYLHIKSHQVLLRTPNRRLGLTFQVNASAGHCPNDHFISEAVPADSLFGKYLASSLPDLGLRALVQEQCAMSFLPNSHQTVAWWVGEGGAGKGTLAKLVEAFHHKIAVLDLHKLQESFHLEALVDATLIRVDEVSQRGPWSEKEFKSIVSGDVVMINPKHKKNYTYRTTAYWILTSNQAPMIRDESDGVRRRIIPVPWLSSAAMRGSSERNLDVKILRDESFIFLSWIVDGLQRYLKRGGPIPTQQLPLQVRALMRKIHQDNNNLETWFEECEIVPADPMFKLKHTKNEIYQHYEDFTIANGETVIPPSTFWKFFWQRPGLQVAGVKPTKLTIAGATNRLPGVINLAITPREIATQKLHALQEAVAERSEASPDAQYRPVSNDPFDLDTQSTDGLVEVIPQYTEEELKETARLKDMLLLTA